MSVTQSMVWFVITAVAVFSLLAFGMWEGTRANDPTKMHLHDLLHRR